MQLQHSMTHSDISHLLMTWHIDDIIANDVMTQLDYDMYIKDHGVLYSPQFLLLVLLLTPCL
jgi:hypothetical protein